MTLEYVPTSESIVVTTVFIILCLIYLFHKLLKENVDLYDFIMLSMIFIAPGVFVYFPGVAAALARITGVAFPFVIMFSFLFLITFGFLYRLVVEIHRQRKINRLLTQKIGLLECQIQSLERVMDPK